jgi:transposase
MNLESVGTPFLWFGFTAFVLAMLILDLTVFHRRAHDVRMREALIWTGVWIGMALLFNFGVYLWFGSRAGLEFLTGYLIEKALSVDNIFVFLVIFSYFRVPSALQHRVLFWGILGALVTRAIFILLGAALLHRFHWVVYIFGAFLVFTGIKLLWQGRKSVHLILDSLPAHKRAIVSEYVASTEGRLTLHFLPGYAPDLNPDELVWSHVKRTGTARRPLQKGETLREKIEEQLSKIQKLPSLIRSFFKIPSVAYISDW